MGQRVGRKNIFCLPRRRASSAGPAWEGMCVRTNRRSVRTDRGINLMCSVQFRTQNQKQIAVRQYGRTDFEQYRHWNGGERKEVVATSKPSGWIRPWAPGSPAWVSAIPQHCHHGGTSSRPAPVDPSSNPGPRMPPCRASPASMRVSPKGTRPQAPTRRCPAALVPLRRRGPRSARRGRRCATRAT